MKKIFILCIAVLACIGIQATERTVWEGNEAISWNTEVAPGTQFETPNGTFTGLKKDNIIRIYTTTTYDDPQYVVTYKAGGDWTWTDLSTTVSGGVITYTVESDQIATEIADRGLILRGQAWTATKITIDAEESQPVVGEQTIWEGSEPISWNTDVAPGTEYELEDIFTGLAKNDVLKFYTTTTYDDPQYVVTYKAGDSWTWTDLSTTVSSGVITYTVESDQIATEIAGRGLIMRGQAYNLVKVTLTKATSTAINDLKATEKVANGVVYNLAGQQVAKGYKGVVIQDGRKYFQK